MIKLEAQELRGVPVIKLSFAPQSEQFTGLGRALSAFVKHAEENFSAFDQGEINFGWCAKPEAPSSVGEVKKPRAEYKEVLLPQAPAEKAPTEPVKLEEENIVSAIVDEAEETKVVQQKVKKKKVETKPASI